MDSVLFYDHDELFQSLYSDGLRETGMPDSAFRKPRFYNLVQMLMATKPLSGECLEAGCFRGLSSYLICNYLKRESKEFTGNGYSIVDSFEGLSEPVSKDLDAVYNVRTRAKKELYAASLESVRHVLSDYPNIAYYKGWIPDVLGVLPENRYRFVHIDLDLYQPILASLEYFYPRLCIGGILVVDDYGYLDFPGAKRAVDEFCLSRGFEPARLTTGNAVIIKHAEGLNQHV